MLKARSHITNGPFFAILAYFMLFNSIEFAVFFPLVVSLYFFTPHKYRWLLLLIASCIFYMAFIPAYILVLAALILIDYSAGIFMEKLEGSKRKLFLIGSILSTVLALFVFKYFDFFGANLTNLAHFLGWNYSIETLGLLLPIGLSFHTFQSLSYVIEVYRGKQKAERNLGIYALYVMFFPQLVAGPIERPYNLLHQFYEKHAFDYQRVVGGLKLMVFGLFKKMVVADTLALFVNQVYGNPAHYEGMGLLVATVFFAFQVYYDFSGYSEIAIGAAQVLGFTLMDNFKVPYLSRSIPEFWTRWHISLSSWFKDYLFLPLYMSLPFRNKRFLIPKAFLSILVVFLVSGLWHGANWTFVAWGALNGFYYMLALATARIWKKMAGFMQIALTFSLISFSLIFFRAKSMQDAFYIIGHLFSGLSKAAANVFAYVPQINIQKSMVLGQPLYELFILAFAFGFLALVYFLQKNGTYKNLFGTKPLWLRWGFYGMLLLSLIFLSALNNTLQFIYFQF